MGGTAWNYFTSYQDDVEKALQALRRDVFENYTKGQRKPSDFDLLAPAEKFAFEGVLDSDDAIEIEGFNSIEELLEETGAEGTHSILDIQRTGINSEFGVAWPAPENALIKLFGTNKPTHEQIAEKAEFELVDELEVERWEAVFVIVYKDGKPSEIYFEGSSGD